MPSLDRKNKIPLFQQLMAAIIQQIESGELAPGDRLLPERKMATAYGINRSTVNHALEELTSLGWLTRRQGSGTEVAKGRWGSRQAPQYQWQQLLAQRSAKQDPYMAAKSQLTGDPQAIDVSGGELPANLVPDFEFPALSWDTLIKEEQRLSNLGYEPLRQILEAQLAHNFNLSLKDQQLLITSGSSQGISLILQTLLQPGDVIATEDPSFLFALPLFQSLGIRIEGIPMDSDGIMPSELEKQLLTKKIKLLYLNPTFQNPTGRCLSYERRQRVVEICQKYYVPIIEDDVFGELGFGESLPRLKELAPQQVLYLGSLSKIFGSAIKVGWLLAPKNLINSLANTRQQLDSDSNLFAQLLANTALRSPDYQQQHRRLITELQQRSEDFCRLLTPLQPDWQYQPIQGGLYYWLTWQHQPLNRSEWHDFLQEKLLVAPSFLFSNDTMAMRVNYTSLTSENGQRFIQRLTKVTQQLKEREKRK